MLRNTKVKEKTGNDIELEVDIAHGQKTGYFLDQKFNRREVGKLAKGCRVLDTFTHTGAFGLNAFKGGAKEVISVDVSPEAVDMVNKNIKLNNAELKMKALCADVFDVLKEYEAKGEMSILDKENMEAMFMQTGYNTTIFNIGDLSNWNVLNVTNMKYMFMNCNKITALDFSNFNTTNVNNMNSMFFNCAYFKTKRVVQSICAVKDFVAAIPFSIPAWQAT